MHKNNKHARYTGNNLFSILYNGNSPEMEYFNSNKVGMKINEAAITTSKLSNSRRRNKLFMFS